MSSKLRDENSQTTRQITRDLIDDIGVEKINEMDRFEVFVKQGRISKQYDEEFEKNGIKYLKLMK